MGFALPHTDQIAGRLAAHRPLSVPREGLREAAVIIPVVASLDGYRVVLIRRSRKLRKHPGQIAFPGGVREPEDRDLQETALREGQEEVGLAAETVRVVGQLDEVWTPTGYSLTPFVGLIPSPGLQPTSEEVDEVLVVRVADLIAPGVFRRETYHRDGQDYRLVFFDLPGMTVWGATGRILLRFLEVGLGWSTPVPEQWESGPHA